MEEDIVYFNPRNINGIRGNASRIINSERGRGRRPWKVSGSDVRIVMNRYSSDSGVDLTPLRKKFGRADDRWLNDRYGLAIDILEAYFKDIRGKLKGDYMVHGLDYAKAIKTRKV